MSVPAFQNKGTIGSNLKPIKGMDISGHQPEVDWVRVKDSGIKFVFIKASEYQKDLMFDTHWANAKANGVIRGAYHYFHPAMDPVAQAQLMFTAVGKLEADDLPCVIDLEIDDGLIPAVVVDNALLFLKEIQTLTGKEPIIYGSPYFLNTLNLDSETFSKYPLWVAHYGVDHPAIPSPWPYWSFWQTGASGNVPGINDPMDTDLFNGTLDQLMKIARGS